MDIALAHKEFQVFLDKLDSQSLPDIRPNEIDILLHEAELRVVKQAYGGNNIYKTGLGGSQKRIDDISTLIKTEVIPFVGGVATLPSDYMFLDRVSIKVKVGSVQSYTTPFLCPHDKLNIVLSDPFNKSTAAYPIVWLENNKLHIDAPDFEVIDAKVTYIKYPKRVSKQNLISSELPEQKQKEAIQLAVRIGLGTIESSRIEEQNQQLGTIE
jgi:hypothetical protein